MRTLDPARIPEYRAVMTVVCLSCGLAAVGSVTPAVEHVVNAGMLGLVGVALVVVGVRLSVRFVRERLEDAADARTADAWRAAHATRSPVRLPVGVL